jgi:hypothetical protein
VTEPQSWDHDSTDLIPRIVRTRRRLQVLLAAATVALAAALATWAVPARTLVDPAAADVVRDQAAAIATALDRTAGTAHQRSDQIATDPVMRAAILTDTQTVADLVKSEHFEVKPLAGETIELFQRDRDSGGDTVTSLLRTPANAPAIRFMPGAGTRIENVGAALHVIVTAEVERLKDGQGYKPTISGSLALSDPMALDDVRKKLAAVALSASITGAGKTPLIVLAPAAGAARGTDGVSLHATIHPNPEWFADLTLEAAPKTIRARQSWILPVRIIGFALAALLFVLSARIAAGTRRSPGPQAGRPG